MSKRILILLVVMALVLSLAACSKKDTKQTEPEPPVTQPDENADPEQTEPEPLVTEPDESTEPEQTEPSDTEAPLTPDPEPGVAAPDNWPLDVPTPVNGEIMGCGWAPDKSFCTTDIAYKQADIDAYGKRLESFGFVKQEEHKYGTDWPDATVYSNGRWDVIVAEENDVFDYSYVNFYPLFDVVTEGYDGQPEGWPDGGDF